VGGEGSIARLSGLVELIHRAPGRLCDEADAGLGKPLLHGRGDAHKAVVARTHDEDLRPGREHVLDIVRQEVMAFLTPPVWDHSARKDLKIARIGATIDRDCAEIICFDPHMAESVVGVTVCQGEDA
jgi:hypothetical protein